MFSSIIPSQCILGFCFFLLFFDAGFFFADNEHFQEKVEFLCKDVVSACLQLVRRSRSVVTGLSELLAVFANDPLARSWVDGELIGRLISGIEWHLDRVNEYDEREVFCFVKFVENHGFFLQI